MPRKRDGFVPLGDVAGAVELPGDHVLTHRAAAAPARRRFTKLDQVTQLVRTRRRRWQSALSFRFSSWQSPWSLSRITQKCTPASRHARSLRGMLFSRSCFPSCGMHKKGRLGNSLGSKPCSRTDSSSRNTMRLMEGFLVVPVACRPSRLPRLNGRLVGRVLDLLEVMGAKISLGSF